jgi:hypothetical protein
VPEAFSAWQLKIEHALEPLEARPPTKVLIKEASAKLKESSALYLLFMEEARKYMALDPPED